MVSTTYYSELQALNSLNTRVLSWKTWAICNKSQANVPCSDGSNNPTELTHQSTKYPLTRGCTDGQDLSQGAEINGNNRQELTTPVGGSCCTFTS